MKAAEILQTVNALAVSYLGEEAAMTAAEVLVLQSSLTQALSNTPPAALERAATWVWPAGLALGSIMYAVRLGRLAAAQMRPPDQPPPATPPPDQPASTAGNGRESAWTAEPTMLDSKGF